MKQPEFIPPARPRHTLAPGQISFLRAIESFAPEVVKALKDLSASAPDELQDAQSVRECLQGFNIETPWLVGESLEAIRKWRRIPHLPKKFPSSIRSFTPPFPMASLGTPLVIEIPGFHPEIERRDGWIRDAKVQFENQLAKYLQSFDKCAIRAGWTPQPEKRNPHHYDWLVLYLVKGLSFAKTGREWFQTAEKREAKKARDQRRRHSEPGEDAVRKSCHLVAAELGLALRSKTRK